MIRSPYKNISGKLEKGVYVCVYLLYGTHVLGFYFFPFYFFFLRSSEHGRIFCIYFFLSVWCPTPHLSLLTEK